jgi:hypothetical protein
MLLGHELAHVAQQRRFGSPVVMRQACGHDGTPTNCGAGALARWRLTDVVTAAVTESAIDTLVVGSMASRFGGSWATQVQTPPNPVKFGVGRGRADGVKVMAGSALRVEVVEVKARSTPYGGCVLATREAQGYVTVLRAIAPAVARIARALAPRGGMRVIGSLSAAQRRALLAAGVDVSDPVTAQAWAFYNSLQNGLDVTFRTPFSSVDVDVNADGTPNTSYNVLTVAVQCKTRRGAAGTKARMLAFQVNRSGGVSYGCSDTECEGDEEEQQRQVQRQPQIRSAPQDEVQTPARVPADHPAARPGDDPAVRPAAGGGGTPYTVPILVGVGTAAAGVATVALRRRAARLAAERAARIAAQAAWRRAAEEAAARRAARTAGGRVAGRAAGRAVAYAEIAAAVALVVLYSDRVSAAPGPGASPLETLYQVMSQRGAPPSPELRRMIEEDPVLRDMAERAGQTGDAGPLQDAITQRVIQLVHDNPDEFTPEDLEVLTHMQYAAGTASGTGPANAAQLRAAIEQARAHRQGGGGAGGTTPATGATGGAGGTPGTGAPGAPRGDARSGAGTGGAGTGTGGAEPHPGLSASARARLHAAPARVSGLFEQMVTRGGLGTRVTDDVVARFLATVPADLSARESRQLVEQISPSAGASADEVISHLAQAVERIRAQRRAAVQAHAPPTPAPSATGETGARRPDPERDQAPSSAAEFVDSMVRSIQTWDEWGTIGPGQARALWSPGTGTIAVRVFGRTPLPNGGSLRYTAVLGVTVRRRVGTRVMVTVEEATPTVWENGVAQQTYHVHQVLPFTDL